MASPGRIQQRDLGTTGLRVSALGLGSSPFRHGEAKDWLPLLRRAMELGITYYDTARSYVNGEDVIGLLDPAESRAWTVTTKTGARGGRYCLEDLQRSLRTMRRSHVDVWMTHMVTSAEEYDMCTALGGFCDIAVAAKGAGLVRATGASFHAGTSLILRAIEERAFDVVMFPLNVIGRETVYGSSIASYRERLLPAARANGVGVVVMKVLAGGEMRHGAPGLGFLADRSEHRDVLGGAVRYATAHPEVTTAVVGMADLPELESNVRSVADASPDPALVDRWTREVDALTAGSSCSRCGLCLDVCPEGIEIPKVFRLYDQARFFGMSGVARYKYGLMEASAGRCQPCERCREACPEDFDIAALLRRADGALARPRAAVGGGGADVRP